MFTFFQSLIPEPAFCGSKEAGETKTFLQTRDRQRAWGGGRVYPRKAPQDPALFQLENLPQRPCLVLMRAACPEGRLLSHTNFRQVFTTAEGSF